MRKVVKFGGVTVGAGLVIGLGVVGWLYMHRSTAAAPGGGVAAAGLNDTSSGSAIPLSSGGGGGSATPTPGLAVTSDGNQGSVMGDQTGGGSSGSGEGGGSDGSGTSTPNPLPGPSGFGVYDQYKGSATAMFIDVQPGTGAAVAASSVVTVQYRGWLTNGKEFDETYAKGKPFTFTENAGSVIPGFAEGMFGMKAGGERRLIIPPSQGYGDSVHETIPADSVLVFDVVLVSVQ